MHTFFLLHVFAGHRRFGDVEEIFCTVINHMCPVSFVVITVDIVSGNGQHDLLERAHMNRLLEHAYSGRVHGSFGAGPCETLSAVRHRKLDTGKGPPVLRSAERPWGLRQLLLRHHAQVECSNALLLVVMEILLVISLNGGCGMLKHALDLLHPTSIAVLGSGIRHCAGAIGAALA